MEQKTGASMRGNRIRKFLSAAALTCIALGLVLVPEQAASQSPQDANPPQSAAEEAVPAFQSPQKSSRPSTSNPAIAIATATTGTRASSTALPASTVLYVALVCTKTSTPSSSPARGREPPRFEPGSSRANGNRSTPPNISSLGRKIDSRHATVTDPGEQISEVSCHRAMQFVNYSCPSRT